MFRVQGDKNIMRKNLVVGILPESKNEWEHRTPLSPKDIAWLIGKNIQVEVASSPLRIFKDSQYERFGAKIVKSFKKANFLIGIKEPPVDTLIPDSVYMVFSHTSKGQKYNRDLLAEFLKKKITLIDYEHITGSHGQRLVYFGRYAGICGMVDTLYVYGQKLKTEGISNPFSELKSAVQYGTYNSAKKALNNIETKIKKDGFGKNICPFVIGILGHGNVSQGAQEVLEQLGAVDIHPRDIEILTRNRTAHKKTIYKLLFQREEKLRSKKGKNFYFEEYLKHPELFESNMDRYLPFLNILVNATYWDKRYPRLLPEKMLKNIYLSNPEFRLKVIGDLSCDIKGTIEITKKSTTSSEPAFVYDPASRKISNDLSHKGIAVVAIDNLPCEFPKESSLEFAEQVREFIYQIAVHGINNIADHHGISNVIRKAVITQNGKLTSRFKYLNKYL